MQRTRERAVIEGVELEVLLLQPLLPMAIHTMVTRTVILTQDLYLMVIIILHWVLVMAVILFHSEVLAHLRGEKMRAI